MKASQGIHFRGEDAVIRAYKNQDIPNWAIFQGNQFLFCDDQKKLSMETGEATLRGVLKMMDKCEDTLTLKVYKNIEGGITNATKYNGSFNFLLGENSRSDQYASYRSDTNNRLENIEKLLARTIPEEGEGIEEPKENISGVNAVIGKILENPDIQQYIATKIITLVEKIIPSGLSQTNATPIMQAAKVAGTPENATDQHEKINSAIDTLLQVDPMLGDHLLKLALIARDTPEKYRSLVTMLNTF